ncbi:MAG: hypothetical protein JXR70_09050 [Spirochaetales bacterium]|nr:hypothetical protein [Spirochaetales bacterium]
MSKILVYVAIILSLWGCISSSQYGTKDTLAQKSLLPRENSPETDLTPDSTNESPTPEPSPFEQSLAISQAAQIPLDGLKLIKNKNHYLYIIRDLNNDNSPELIFLGFESDNQEKYNLNELKDFSLLYQEKGVSFRYYLIIFSSHISGEYEMVSQIDLGKWIVFKSFHDFSLSLHKNDPSVISVIFQTKEGSVEVWIIFSGNSFIPKSQLLLEETLFQHFSVDDLDEDGLLDVIVQERLMEEGFGYETMLAWKKWNGRDLEEYKTTNIVRRLNEFLDKVKSHLINNQIAGFLNLVLESGSLRKYRIQGLSDTEILNRMLGLAILENTSGEQPVFIDIIFPEIRDNPFTIKTELGWNTKLVFRIVFSYFGSYFQEIVEVNLHMNHNPFQEKQFSFQVQNR